MGVWRNNQVYDVFLKKLLFKPLHCIRKYFIFSHLWYEKRPRKASLDDLHPEDHVRVLYNCFFLLISPGVVPFMTCHCCFFTAAGNILHWCNILIFNIASLTEVDSNRLTSNAAPMSPNLNPTVPQWKSKWKEICKIVVGGWRWHEHNLKSTVPPFHDWGAICQTL